MDEVTKQFYEEMRIRAPKNARGNISWQSILGGCYDSSIASQYKRAENEGLLPAVGILLNLNAIFSKSELEFYVLYKMRNGRPKMTTIKKYENFFGKPYPGKRPIPTKKNTGLSYEERELEIKRKRSPFEKKRRRRLLMEHVWQMEAAGLISQSDTRDGYRRKNEFGYE